MTRLIAIIGAAIMLLAAPATAGARVPEGFIGMSPQSAPDETDFELMRKAGVRSVRWPLFWMGVEHRRPFLNEPAWEIFDRVVELAARYEMRVMPFVWGTPSWVAQEVRTEPVDTAFQRRAWTSFLRRAVRRYGRNGLFWRLNPELPELPVRAWEIWNEENIVTYGEVDPKRFARLIVISGRVLRRNDRGADLIVGGLFGRPLQVPPNLHIGQFMRGIYEVPGIKRWFDGIGLHPYVARAGAMRWQIRTLRRVMRENGDGATKLYITEMGWGSNSYQSRWERGPRGQARELHRAFSLLANNRVGWRIGGVWWFSWADAYGGCQFCDSAGLLTENREAKPAWYRFTAWTGGDPRIVPRARLFD